MLTLLSLKDFVIVPFLTVEAEEGLTCLTGETGAGKSILLDALGMVLGSRGDAGVIREGAQRAEVCAEFTLPPKVQAWLEATGNDAPEGTVLLRRTVDRKGRSRSWINDTPATVRRMRELGARLVAVHGQSQSQTLMMASHQLQLVDAYAQARPALLAVRDRWNAWQKAEHRLLEATEGRQRLQAEAERLQWMAEILEELSPEEGEWERISSEHAMLANAAQIAENAAGALECLTQGDVSASQLLARARACLEQAARFDSQYETYAQSVDDAAAVVEDASRAVSRHLEKSSVDESRYAEIDERLQTYWKLSKKFQRAPEELGALLAETKKRLAEIDAGFDAEALSKEAQEAEAAFREEAAKLTAVRGAAAAKLSSKVTDLMQSLAMAGGAFEARMVPCAPWALGLERCEFFVRGHAGAEMRPLSRVASGGELSRISLAVSVVTAQVAPVPTMLFDEVDAGIGGAVAESVGSLLRRLARSRQVLTVTHLPQVAAFGQHHWRVEKTTKDGVTTSSLSPLSPDGRVEEIARMLGGSHRTEAARKTAQELLSAAENASAPDRSEAEDSADA